MAKGAFDANLLQSEICPMHSNRTAMKRVAGIWFSVILAIMLAHGCIPRQAKRSVRSEHEFNEALTLYRAERYVKAHENALTAHGEYPENTKYMSLLGWTYLKQGNLGEAERLFAAIYAKDKNDISALQGFAWLAYIRRQLKASEKWFEKEINWAQGHVDQNDWRLYKEEDQSFILSVISDGYYGLGLISFIRHNLSNSQAHLERALRFRNDFIGHGPIKGSLGDVFYSQGEYKTAALFYRESLKEKKIEPVFVKLAWCLYFMNDKGGAQDLFRKGMETAKDRRPFLYGLVFATYALGKTSEAEGLLRELIELDPYFADTPYLKQIVAKTKNWKALYKTFASAYFQRGDYKRAFHKLKGYLPYAKNDCEALLMEAWCHVYLGGLTTALSKFTVLSNREKCPKTQSVTGRGVALLYLRRLNEAKSAFIEAQRIDPRNIRAKVALGAVAYLKGNFQEAIKIYTANLHLLPKKERVFAWPSHALNNLGWSYISTGRYMEAVMIFKRLKGYHPKPIYPAVFNGLGWAHLYQDRMNEAKKAFEKALGLDPKSAQALIGLSATSSYR